MKEFLTRRLGPAPIWVYLAVLGVGGIILIRRHQANAALASNNGQANATGAAIDPATGVPYTTELAEAQTAYQAPPSESVALPSGASYTGTGADLSTFLSAANPTTAPATPTGIGSPPVAGAIPGQNGSWWEGLPNPAAAVAAAKAHKNIGWESRPPAGTASAGYTAPGYFSITGWPPAKGTAPPGPHTYYVQVA
jgi:hypothetical protein